MAEVSRITPVVSLSVTTAAAGIPWHSWAASASHGTEGSVKGAEVGGQGPGPYGRGPPSEPGSGGGSHEPSSTKKPTESPTFPRFRPTRNPPCPGRGAEGLEHRAKGGSPHRRSVPDQAGTTGPNLSRPPRRPRR